MWILRYLRHPVTSMVVKITGFNIILIILISMAVYALSRDSGVPGEKVSDVPTVTVPTSQTVLSYSPRPTARPTPSNSPSPMPDRNIPVIIPSPIPVTAAEPPFLTAPPDTPEPSLTPERYVSYPLPVADSSPPRTDVPSPEEPPVEVAFPTPPAAQPPAPSPSSTVSPPSSPSPTPVIKPALKTPLARFLAFIKGEKGDREKNTKRDAEHKVKEGRGGDDDDEDDDDKGINKHRDGDRRGGDRKPWR